MELNALKKIHFIGIKGVAMAGLAVICKQRAIEVRGSDVAEVFITDEILERAGIQVFSEFAAANLDWSPEAVVVGTSWSKGNIELDEAGRRGLQLISDSELRGHLSSEKTTVAVTGVHGKTTTTGWLAHVLKAAGRDPAFLVGTGLVPDLDGNAAWGSGPHFVVEGDEYARSLDDHTPKFLELDPAVSIITSLEWEHVDIYQNVEALEAVFAALVAKTRQLVVACGDWPSIQRITKASQVPVALYGFDPGNEWTASSLAADATGQQFEVFEGGQPGTEGQRTLVRGQSHGVFSIRLFGKHNILNALAVLIAARELGLTDEEIRPGLESFRGTQRRFDVTEQAGHIFVDDYGHHPTEVAATLAAVRQKYPDKKIWCVFQPHMASRTKALLDQFAVAFGAADRVFIADIFASARESAIGISSKDLVAAVAKHHPAVEYSGSLEQTIGTLRPTFHDAGVLLTMGAGDVYKVRDALLSGGKELG